MSDKYMTPEEATKKRKNGFEWLSNRPYVNSKARVKGALVGETEFGAEMRETSNEVNFFSIDSVHIDKPMTQYLQGFQQSVDLGFIGNEILPEVKVKKESDKYFTLSSKDAMSIPENIERSAAGNFARVDITNSTGSYSVLEYAIEIPVPYRVINNSDQPMDPVEAATRSAMEMVMRNREKTQADAIFNATTFASYTSALGSGTQWDDYTNSAPWVQADSAVESVRQNGLVQANFCAMGKQVWDKLKRNPQMLQYVTGGATAEKPGLITKENAAAAFDIDKIYVGMGVYNSANYGQTATAADIWGKYAFFGYVDPLGPSLYSPTLGMTLVIDGMTVETYQDNSIDSIIVRVRDLFQAKITNTAAGYLYSSVIS